MKIFCVQDAWVTIPVFVQKTYPGSISCESAQDVFPGRNEQISWEGDGAEETVLSYYDTWPPRIFSGREI